MKIVNLTVDVTIHQDPFLQMLLDEGIKSEKVAREIEALHRSGRLIYIVHVGLTKAVIHLTDRGLDLLYRTKGI